MRTRALALIWTKVAWVTPAAPAGTCWATWKAAGAKSLDSFAHSCSSPWAMTMLTRLPCRPAGWTCWQNCDALTGLRPYFDENQACDRFHRGGVLPNGRQRLLTFPATAELDTVTPIHLAGGMELAAGGSLPGSHRRPQKAPRAFRGAPDSHGGAGADLSGPRRREDLARRPQELAGCRASGAAGPIRTPVRDGGQVRVCGRSDGIQTARGGSHDTGMQGPFHAGAAAVASPLETLPAEIGLFDLVVIDEASQSDIWRCLPCSAGRKVLVVGDQQTGLAVGRRHRRGEDQRN